MRPEAVEQLCLARSFWPVASGASLNCWSIHHRGPERGCVEDQPQQLALDEKSDYEVGLGALRRVLRTQSRSNNLGMLGVASPAGRRTKFFDVIGPPFAS